MPKQQFELARLLWAARQRERETNTQTEKDIPWQVEKR